MRSGAECLLEVSGLSVQGRGGRRGARALVRDVSFDVRRGEVVGLIGESGAGKSTIGLAAMGYVRPGCAITSGRVIMGSTDVLALGRDELLRWRGLRVGYVAQSAAAAFNPALRLGAQIVEAPVFHGLVSGFEARRRSVDMFRRVDLPDPDLIGSKFPHQVSGGQLQRLLAVMAVACGPDLLVLDEPTTALDVTTQVHLLKTLKGVLAEEGRSAIYVTHDLATVSQIADWIVVLRHGEIVEQGSIEQIISNPAEVYTKQLVGAVRPSPRTISAPRGKPLEAAPDRRPPLLSLSHIEAGYGPRGGRRWDRTVLSGIDLDLGPGEILGVIGESGSGKSTLARVISGLLPAAQGTVSLEGKPLPASLRERSPELLRRIQLVTQMPDLAFNPTHRIGDILGRPLEFYFGMDRGSRRARVVELLEMVALPADYVGRLPSELSGGEKQRINLARALAARPSIILCDEVTSALDTLVTIRVLDLLRSFREKLGISIVFISHDISTVSELSDRIAVLYNGRIVQQGPTKDVVEFPYHPYTRLLMDSVPELRPGWLEERDPMDMPKGWSPDRPAAVSRGCSFYPRCPIRIEGLCNSEDPPLRLSDRGATIACQRDIEDLRGPAVRADGT